MRFTVLSSLLLLPLLLLPLHTSASAFTELLLYDESNEAVLTAVESGDIIDLRVLRESPAAVLRDGVKLNSQLRLDLWCEVQSNFAGTVRFDFPDGSFHIEGLWPFEAGGSASGSGDRWDWEYGENEIIITISEATQDPEPPMHFKFFIIDSADPEYDRYFYMWGQVEATLSWQTVTFRNDDIDKPRVFAFPATRNDPDLDQALPQIRNVGTDSFQIRIVEPSGGVSSSGQHDPETVSWLVTDDGYKSGGNSMAGRPFDATIQEERNAYTPSNWQRVGFDSRVSSYGNGNPVAFSQLQTLDSGNELVHTRQRSLTNDDFEWAMERSKDKYGSAHGYEDVASIVIGGGTTSHTEYGITHKVETHVTSNSVTHDPNTGWVTFSTLSNEKDVNYVMSKAHTFDGGNPGWARFHSRSGNTVSVFCEEDSVTDGVSHTTEVFGLIAVSCEPVLITEGSNGYFSTLGHWQTCSWVHLKFAMQAIPYYVVLLVTSRPSVPEYYMREGAAPTAQQYDQAILGKTDTTVDMVMLNPTQNTGWVGLYTYLAPVTFNATLVAAKSTAAPFDSLQFEFTDYHWYLGHVTISGTRMWLTVTVTPAKLTSGQALYLRAGAMPTIYAHDVADADSSSSFSVTFNCPTSGATYYFGFYSHEDRNMGVTFEVTQSPDGLYLTGLSASPALDQAFSQTRYSYTVSLPYNTDSITVSPGLPASATFQIFLNGVLEYNNNIGPLTNLPVGANTILVRVSRCGANTDYTITATRAQSADPRISSITVEGSVTTAPSPWDPDHTSYTMVMPAAVSSTSVSYEPVDPPTECTFTGPDPLAVGSNVYRGDCVAQAGNSVVYNFNFYRRSDNSYLGIFTLSAFDEQYDIGFTKTTMSYSLEVLNSVTSISTTVRAEDHPKATASASGFSGLVVGTNTARVVVTSEEGTTRTYTVTINRSNQPPVIVDLSPEDDSELLECSSISQLKLKFNEPMAAGNGFIHVVDETGVDVTQLIPASSTDFVQVNGEIVDINTAPLRDGGAYHILIDGNALTNVVGKQFPAVSDPTAWSFTCSGSEPPELTGRSPNPGASNLDGPSITSITLDFDEYVFRGTGGSIKIVDKTGVEAERVIGYGSDSIDFDGKRVEISFPALGMGRAYYVVISSTVFRNYYGLFFAGISSASAYTFDTSGSIAPKALEYSPHIAHSTNQRSPVTTDVCLSLQGIAVTDRCFVQLTSVLTPPNIHDECQREYGEQWGAASLHDIHQHDELLALAATLEPPPSAIGLDLRSSGQNNDFRWSDGTPFDFRYWRGTSYTGYEYAVLSAEGGFIPGSASTSYVAFCSIILGDVATAVADFEDLSVPSVAPDVTLSIEEVPYTLSFSRLTGGNLHVASRTSTADGDVLLPDDCNSANLPCTQLENFLNSDKFLFDDRETGDDSFVISIDPPVSFVSCDVFDVEDSTSRSVTVRAFDGQGAEIYQHALPCVDGEIRGCDQGLDLGTTRAHAHSENSDIARVEISIGPSGDPRAAIDNVLIGVPATEYLINGPTTTHIYAVFDENVWAGSSGAFTIVDLTAAEPDRVIPAASVSIVGKTVEIPVQPAFGSGRAYYVHVDQGALVNYFGLEHEGIAHDSTNTWTIYTAGSTPPGLVVDALQPKHLQDDVRGPDVSQLTLVFDEAVWIDGKGELRVWDRTNVEPERVIRGAEPQHFQIDGRTVQVTVPTLGTGRAYYVTFSHDLFRNFFGIFNAGLHSKSDWQFSTIGSTAPTVTSRVPSDNANNLPCPGISQLQITLDEAAFRGVTGQISIFDETGVEDSRVIGFNSHNISYQDSDSTDAKTLKVDFFPPLGSGRAYYVTISSKLVQNFFDQPFAGYSGSSAWDFTCSGSVPPVLVSRSPKHMGANLNGPSFSKLVMTFDENVFPSTSGTIRVVDLTGVEPERLIEHDASNVTVEGKTVTAQLGTPLGQGRAYYVVVGRIVRNFFGHDFTGVTNLADWTFWTSGSTAPKDKGRWPPNGATELLASNVTFLTIVFDENVWLSQSSASGAQVEVRLVDRTGVEPDRVFPRESQSIVTNENVLTVHLGGSLGVGRAYEVRVGSKVAANYFELDFAGLPGTDGGAGSWTIATAGSTAPVLLNESPSDGTRDLVASSVTVLLLQFDENVFPGDADKRVRIVDLTGVEPDRELDLEQASIDGHQLEVTIAPALGVGRAYDIRVDRGYVVNFFGLEFEGITAGSWQLFTSGSTGVEIVGRAPKDGDVFVHNSTNQLQITFTENIKAAGTGSITIVDRTGNHATQTIPVGLGVGFGTKTISYNVVFREAKHYYVELPNTAFVNYLDVPFHGISGVSAWNFLTSGATPPTLTNQEPPPGTLGIEYSTFNVLKLSFSENVVEGSGTGFIHDRTGVEATRFFTTDNMVGWGTKEIDITISSSGMGRGRAYYIVMDGAMFKSYMGLSFDGINGDTEWRLGMSGGEPPHTIFFDPYDDSTSVPYDPQECDEDDCLPSTLSIFFDQNVFEGTGSFQLEDLTGNHGLQTIPASSVYGWGSRQLYVPVEFQAGKHYQVTSTPNLMLSALNNSHPGFKTDDELGTWNFITADGTAPEYVHLEPAGGSVDNPAPSVLNITFSENMILYDPALVDGGYPFPGCPNCEVLKSSGVFRIVDQSGVEEDREYLFTDPERVSGLGTKVISLHVDPDEPLSEAFPYTVDVLPESLQSYINIGFEGVEGIEDWHFVTEGTVTPPVITSLVPADNDHLDGPSTQALRIGWDERVFTSSNDTMVIIVDRTGVEADRVITHSSVSGFGTRSLNAPISPPLGVGRAYYLVVGSDTIQNYLDAPFAGIDAPAALNAPSQWDVTTTGANIPTFVESELLPTPGSTEVDWESVNELVIPWSENVWFNFGTLYVVDETGTHETQEIDVGSCLGAGTRTTRCPVTLLPGRAYYITFGGSLFHTYHNQFNPGILSQQIRRWSFYTKDGSPPVVVARMPAGDPDTQMVYGPIIDRIELTFDENVQRGDANTETDLITITDRTGVEDVRTITMTSVTGFGTKELMAFFSPPLSDDKSYYVNIPPTMFKNYLQMHFEGMDNDTVWRFRSVGSFCEDVQPPYVRPYVVDGFVSWDTPSGTSGLETPPGLNLTEAELFGIALMFKRGRTHTNETLLEYGDPLATGDRELMTVSLFSPSPGDETLLRVDVNDPQGTPIDTDFEMMPSTLDETDRWHQVIVLFAVPYHSVAVIIDGEFAGSGDLSDQFQPATDSTLRVARGAAGPFQGAVAELRVFTDTIGLPVNGPDEPTDERRKLTKDTVELPSVYWLLADQNVDFELRFDEGGGDSALDKQENLPASTLSEHTRDFAHCTNPPLATQFTPRDEALELDATEIESLTIDFDENIFQGTGVGVEVIDMTQVDLISSSGHAAVISVPPSSCTGFGTRQITIPVTLEAGKRYAVRIGSSAFVDLFNASYGGIADGDLESWNFATRGGEPPALLSVTPEDDDDDVDPSTSVLTMTFDQNVDQGEPGFIDVLDLTGNHPLQRVNLESGSVTGWRTKVLEVRVEVRAGKHYVVKVPQDAVRSLVNVGSDPVSGLAWSFISTGGEPPEVIGLDPGPGSREINASSASLELEFSERILRGDAGQTLTIVDRTGQESDRVLSTDDMTGFNSTRVSVTITPQLTDGKYYTVHMSDKLFVSHINLFHAGIADDDFESWWFITSGGPPPSLTDRLPLNGTTEVPDSINSVTLTFNENVLRGNGIITVNDLTGRHAQQRIGLSSGGVTGFGTKVISVNVSMQEGSVYSLRCPVTAFVSLTDKHFPGLLDQFDYNWFVAGSEKPVVTALSPEDNNRVVFAEDADNVVISFDQVVLQEPGTNSTLLYIHDITGRDPTKEVPVSLWSGWGSNSVAVPMLNGTIEGGSYVVEFPGDVIRTWQNKTFDGYSFVEPTTEEPFPDNDWNFQMEGGDGPELLIRTPDSVLPVDDEDLLDNTAITSIDFEFDQNVFAFEGEFVIRDMSGRTADQVYPVNSSSITGYSTSNISMPVSLQPGTLYAVLATPGALIATTQFLWVGVRKVLTGTNESWHIATHNRQAPAHTALVPPTEGGEELDALLVGPETLELSLTFDQNVVLDTNDSAVFVLTDRTGVEDDMVLGVDAITGWGTPDLVVSLSRPLGIGRAYDISTPDDLVRTYLNMSWPGAGQWRISTTGSTAPTITSHLPLSTFPSVGENLINGTETTSLVLNFDENVFKGSGNATVTDLTGREPDRFVPVDSMTGWGSRTITVPLAGGLGDGMLYAVSIDSAAMQNLFGLTYAGIEAGDHETFVFGTLGGGVPEVDTLSPGDDVIELNAFNISHGVITFNENVQVGPGSTPIRVVDRLGLEDDAELNCDSDVVIDGKSVSLPLFLVNGKRYSILIPSDCWMNMLHVHFDGFHSVDDWNFTMTNGPANHFNYTVQPPTQHAAVSEFSLEVVTHDEFHNPVKHENMVITAELHRLPDTFGGQTVIVSSREFVTNLVGEATITLEASRIGEYEVVTKLNSRSAVRTTSDRLEIVPNAQVEQVQFSQQPGGADAVPNIPFPDQPQLEVMDGGGNVITFDSSTSVSCELETDPSNTAQLIGNVTVNATQGIVSFVDLGLDHNGNGFSLRCFLTEDETIFAVSSLFDLGFGRPFFAQFITQPSDGAVFAPLVTQPVVAIYDEGENLMTEENTRRVRLRLVDAPGARITGNNIQTVVGGIATFSGLSLNLVGEYVMQAEIVDLSDPEVTAQSESIEIRNAPPSAAVVTQSPPPTTQALENFAIEVRIHDAFGNPVLDTAGLNVTVAVQIGPDGGSVASESGTLVVPIDDEGFAVFSDLRLDVVGTYSLRIFMLEVPSVSVVAQQQISVVANENIAGLQFAVNPFRGYPNGFITVNWPVAPVVAVLDPVGNIITSDNSTSIRVTIDVAEDATLPLPNGTVLSGDLVVPVREGFASFPGLSVNTNSDDFVLRASVAGVPAINATSSTFTIILHGEPTQLRFETQPPSSMVSAESMVPAPVVSLRDTHDLFVVTGTHVVALLIDNNAGSPSQGLLFGSTQAAVDEHGLATFDDISIDRKGVGYTLRAVSSSGPFEATSSAFSIIIGEPVALRFDQQPDGDITGGLPFGTQPQLALYDAGNNRINDTSLTASVALVDIDSPGQSSAPAVLEGEHTAAFVDGRASFTDLRIRRGGTYVLAAEVTLADNTTLRVDSQQFVVETGPLARIVYITQPSGARGGQVMINQPVVYLSDAGGLNVIRDQDGVLVTIELAEEHNTIGATLRGTFTLPVRGATASWSNLEVDKVTPEGFAGLRLLAKYQLDPTISTLSEPFQVGFGVPASVTWQADMPDLFGGEPQQTPVSIAVLDRGGNVVGNDNSSIVTVSIADNAGSPPGLLGGTAVRAVTGGLVSFNDLAIDREGLGYRLKARASSPADSSQTYAFEAISSSFDVIAGSAHSLVIIIPPGGPDTYGGEPFNLQPIVYVLDRGGNIVRQNSETVIEATVSTNPTGSTLISSSVMSVTLVNGEASFSGIGLNTAGTGYRLTFTGTFGNDTVLSVTSDPFDVEIGEPVAAQIDVQPAASTAAGDVFGLSASLRDLGGNIAFKDERTTAKISIAGQTDEEGEDAVVLLGALEQEVTGEMVFVFSSLSQRQPGEGFSILVTITLANLQQFTVETAPYAIEIGEATSILFLQEPSTQNTAGLPLVTQPIVALHDKVGNLVESENTEIHLQLVAQDTDNTESTHLLGGTYQIFSEGGVANFTDLIANVSRREGYRLVAQAYTDADQYLTELGVAASNTFFIRAAELANTSILVQPGDSRATDPFGPQPRMELLDRFGNLLTYDSETLVGARILSGDESGGVLLGSHQVAAVSGVASFSNLAIDVVGEYTLELYVVTLDPQDDDGRLFEQVTDSITVRVNVPAQLESVVEVRPTAKSTPLLPTPEVRILDAGGNMVVNDNESRARVALIEIGPQQGAQILGLKTRTAVNGVLRWDGIAISVTGLFKLRFFYHGTASQKQLLGFETQNLNDTTSDEDEDEDDGPNPDDVDLGVPLFFTDSAEITVIPPIPTSIVFACQPGGGVATASFEQAPEVWLLDGANDIIVGNSADVVELRLVDAGPDGARFNGHDPSRASDVLSRQLRQGTTQPFTELTINRVGTYRLEAFMPAYGFRIVSNPFEVRLGPCTHCVWVWRPNAPAAGDPIREEEPLPQGRHPVIEIRDLGENVCVHDSGYNVTVSIVRRPNASVIVEYVNDVYPWLALETARWRSRGEVSQIPVFVRDSNDLGELAGQRVVPVVNGVARFDNLILTQPGPGYQLSARTGQRIYQGQENEGLSPIDVGSPLPRFSASSDRFDVLPYRTQPPDRVRVSERLQQAALPPLWTSTTLGPILFMVGVALISSIMIFSTHAQNKTQHAWHIPLHMLMYLTFVQMFILPVEHNIDLDEVFDLFYPMRVFQGNVDTDQTVPVFAYAHGIMAKALAVIGIVLLGVLASGLFVQACFSSFTVRPSHFTPFVLFMFLPIVESVIDACVDLGDNYIGLDGKLFAWVGCGLMLLGVGFVWVNFANRDFEEMRDVWRTFMPEGRGIAALWYRPNPRKVVRRAKGADDPLARAGSTMDLLHFAKFQAGVTGLDASVSRSDTALADSDDESSTSLNTATHASKKEEKKRKKRRKKKQTSTGESGEGTGEGGGSLNSTSSSSDLDSSDEAGSGEGESSSEDETTPGRFLTRMPTLSTGMTTRVLKSTAVPYKRRHVSDMEAARHKVHAWRWRMSFHRPGARYLQRLEQRETNRRRRTLYKMQSRGMMQSPMYEEFARLRESWQSFFWRPFYATQVMYTTAAELERAMLGEIHEVEDNVINGIRVGKSEAELAAERGGDVQRKRRKRVPAETSGGEVELQVRATASGGGEAGNDESGSESESGRGSASESGSGGEAGEDEGTEQQVGTATGAEDSGHSSDEMSVSDMSDGEAETGGGKLKGGGATSKTRRSRSGLAASSSKASLAHLSIAPGSEDPELQGVRDPPLHQLRSATAHNWMWLKLVFLVVYGTFAVVGAGASGMLPLVILVSVYLLLLVLVTPYRNPYMQKEVLLMSSLLLCLVLLMEMLNNPSTVWSLVGVAWVQLLIVPGQLLLMVLFKEPPEVEIQEFVKDNAHRGAAAEAMARAAAGFDMEYMSAEELLRRGAMSSGETSAHYLRIGIIYWSVGGRHRAERRYAYASFARAAKIDPMNALALAYLGHWYQMFDEDGLDKAIRFYRAALDAEPTNEQAGRALTKLYEREGHPGHALAVIEDAIEAANVADEPAAASWAHALKLQRRQKRLSRRSSRRTSRRSSRHSRRTSAGVSARGSPENSDEEPELGVVKGFDELSVIQSDGNGDLSQRLGMDDDDNVSVMSAGDSIMSAHRAVMQGSPAKRKRRRRRRHRAASSGVPAVSEEPNDSVV